MSSLDDFSVTTKPDNRTAPRYLVRWKMAVVYEDQERKPTYHGRTYDLSLAGTGMLTNVNLQVNSLVTILLAPPPLHVKDRLKVIEIKSRQLGAVYSGETRCFRLRFAFLEFKNDGFEFLQERLKNHMSVTKVNLVKPVR
jgi:hypothetical protein